MIKACLAGATGWAGSELARSMARTGDLGLVSAVARQHAGRVLGEVLGESRLTARIHASAAEALVDPCDVLVEYTKPDSAKANVLTALAHDDKVDAPSGTARELAYRLSKVHDPSRRFRRRAQSARARAEARQIPACRSTPFVCPAT